MLVAVEHLGSVGVGITSPQFFRANDGKIYVVKLQGNRLGLKVLVNELLAAKFGEIMNLRFPPSGIIHINPETLHKNPLLVTRCIDSGRHFASQFLANAVYAGTHNLDKAANTAEMAGVILFDHIFLNADRANNKKNLLLHQEGDKHIIYAIDNSHLFKSGNWTLQSLNCLDSKRRTYYRLVYEVLLQNYLSPVDFIPYINRIKELAADQIDELVRQIPDEWLPDKTERQALSHYTKIRCGMVDEIYGKLCKQIPQAHGGGKWLTGKAICCEARRKKAEKAWVFSSKRFCLNR